MIAACSLRSNIWKLYIMQALTSSMVLMPIAVLFFGSLWLNLAEILLLQTVFSIALVLFEIPTWFLGDKIGRKQSLCCWILCMSLGYWGYWVAWNFWTLALVEIVLALWASFISGSNSALLYDTLLGLGKTKNFSRIWWRFQSIASFAEAGWALLGGFLASYGWLMWPAIAQAILASLAIPFVFTLVEPTKHKDMSGDSTGEQLKKIITYSLHGHPEIKWFILYGSFLGAATWTMTRFTQPYWELVNVPLARFWIGWAVINASVWVFSLVAHRVEKEIGRTLVLFLLPVLVGVSYLMMWLFPSIWLLFLFFVFTFVRALQWVVLTDAINQIVSSSMRATVMSIQSLFFRGAFAIISPFLWWVANLWSLPIALVLSAIIFGMCSLVALVFLRKNTSL